jgi:serine/threonine-protein kinase
MSPGKDQDYFCEGMAEEIMSALTGVPGLRVAARSSAFRFRGGEHDLREVGKTLDVKTVLEGSVRTAGQRLRVTARLNQADGGYQIWSRRYDRELEDVFAIQDEIASDIVDALRLELSEADTPRVVRHTENQEAYDLYLRGRHLWYARTKVSLAKAMEYYQQAVEKDPSYALPYVGLADGYTIQAMYGYLPEDVAVVRANESLERALAINDRLSEAHRAKALTQVLLEFDFRAAVTSLEKSIELDPSNALAHVVLSWCAWPGRESACLAAARRAQELDPMNPYVNSITAISLDFWGRRDEALQSFLRALEFDRDYLPALFGVGGLYSKMGRHQEALAAFTRAVELTDRESFYLAYLGWGLARAGRGDEARAILDQLSERAKTERVAPLHLAMVVSSLGELDRAFALLDEAYEEGNCWIGSPRAPMFEAFRGDPRFDALLERMDHPDR